MATPRWPAFTGNVRLWPLRNGGGLRLELQVRDPARERSDWIIADRRHLRRLKTIRAAMNMAPLF